MQLSKKNQRLRRATKTRGRIQQSQTRYGKTPLSLCVFRSNQHIYAQVFSDFGAKVVAQASTLENTKKDGKRPSNSIAQAVEVGKRVAQRALKAGVKECAFDRSGFLYHGKVKALAEAAREEGLKF